MKISEIEDSSKVLVKEADKIHFNYKGEAVEAEIRFHNGFFIVESPSNKPISCMLSDILKHTDAFNVAI